MSIVKKILGLDARIIFVGLVVMFVIPILYPIALPMDIQSLTRESYEFIDNIPANSVVLIENSYTAATYPQGGPGLVVLIHHLLTNEVDFVMFSLSAQGVVWADLAINTALPKLPSEVSAEYGVDYVLLNFVPGMETGIAAFGRDIRSVISEDYYGTPIDNLQLMEDINSATDFVHAMWWADADGSVPFAVKQLVVPYGVQLTSSVSINDLPSISPYLGAGQVQGCIAGLRGSAEYELLRSLPGPATGQMTALNFAGLYFLGLVLLGNIAYLLDRRGAKLT